MSVCDVPVIHEVCNAAGDAAGAVVTAPFDWLAQGMGGAAEWMFTSVWKVIDTTTVVEVTSGEYTKVYNIMFGVGVFVWAMAGWWPMAGHWLPENVNLHGGVIDGLFHIAKADGLIHEQELAFLGRIAEIFRITEDHFETIMARHVHMDGRDPYRAVSSPVRDLPDLIATAR